MGKKVKSGFIQGAIIIAFANILVKVIGAIFKIPLDRMVLQTDGMALYNTAYTIYNLLFVISTAGLPTAISKLVAESDSRGDYEGSEKILKISFILLLCLGGIGSLVLGLGARFFSNVVGYPDAYLTMLVMSPSLIFVGMVSAFRGYFQGKQNMVPTAVSEVIEATCKLLVGLSLAYMLLPKGKMYSSAGAIAGVTVGSTIAFLYLAFTYIASKKHRKKEKDTNLLWKDVLKSIVKIAIPITLGVSVFTLTSFIDTAMVTNQMKAYINESFEANETVLSNLSEEQSERYLNLEEEIKSENVEATDKKLSEKKAGFIYGYLVRAITLFNMPAVVIAAIATSVVPAIASANAENDKNKGRSFTKAALLIATVLSLPCALGMSVLAKPILLKIYGDGSFSILLNIMGIAVAFLTLVQIVNALLQAWGKVWIPVVNMLIGGVVKIGVNLILVGRPEINIVGAPIGTLLCYIVVVALNVFAIIKETKVQLKIKDFIIKPVFCTVIMGIFTYVTYKSIFDLLGSTLALVLSIAVSVLIYFSLIAITKTLTEEEILLLPKGKKIASLMKKVKLL